MRRIGLLIFTAVLVLFGCSEPEVAEERAVTAEPVVAPTEEVMEIPAGIFVNPNESLGPISPYIFGTNFGPWMVVTVDMMEAADNAGIRFLRWPGGHWGDINDVTDRQVDQYIAQAERMGAEPSINTRLLDGSPEQSAELVRYTNIEQGYGVKYWGIGNEPTLYDDYSTAQFNADWRAHAEAMKAVDPDILLYGPEPHQYLGTPQAFLADAEGNDYLTSFLRENGDLVDIVAIHRYPFPQLMTQAVTIDDLRLNSREWDRLIPALRELIKTETGRDLPIAVTEINSHWSPSSGGDAALDSHYNAIWYGDVLGRMIVHQVDYVAHFRLQSNNFDGGFGLLARRNVRPSYYTFQMYKHFGSEQLFAISDNEDVRVYAARRDDGSITVMVINLLEEGETIIPLAIHGMAGEVSETWLFDQAHNAESVENTFWVDGELTVPSQSMTMFVVESP